MTKFKYYQKYNRIDALSGKNVSILIYTRNVKEKVSNMTGRRQNQKRTKEKGKLRIFTMVLLVLLAVNIFLLLKIEIQLKSANDALKQLEYTRYTGMRDEKQKDVIPQEAQNIIQGTKQEQPQKYLSASNDAPVVGTLDYVSMCGLPKVDKPAKRSYYEILEKLSELGKENTVIGQILKESEAYSEEMLGALANNPEMADFVGNYLTRKSEAAGGLTDLERQQEYPLFLQWDPRWGYVQYGDDGSNIGLSGCGPTCLSMMLYYLTKDEALTPDIIAQFSMDNGYYLAGTGTLWTLLEELPILYGVRVSQPQTSEYVMKSELDKGNILICSMREGDFTAGGHFIVIYGYNEDGFQVNDSNCVARSRQSWSFGQIEHQIKHIWSYEY